MQFVAIYVTCKDTKQASYIARKIVEERLAACGNVLGPIESHYWWEGKLEQSTEVSLLLKTRDSLTQKVIDRVKELHSYDVPCVIAFSIVDGNPDFLKWIESETLSS